MVSLSVKADIKAATRYLTRVQKKQIPFATAQALTDTAFDSRKALRAQVIKKLDRPTKFTIDAFQVEKARKTRLRSVLFVEAKRWKYLRYQIEGGTRRAANKLLSVPTKNRKLNRYGNIPGKRRGLVKGKKQFMATIDGVPGVWERFGRRGSQVRLLIALEPKAEYKKRFPFHKIVAGVVRSKFRSNFDRRLAHALRTAR